ncbi:MAG TPA: MmgE/PrpD family protein [Deltaproteobacteria bacterium]|nr:MmgE/PrpD family protein [Deltaproteobacteria bacterium]
MNMADRLSSFVVETTFKDIPADTVRFTKELALKTTAGMLAGSRLSESKKFIAYIKEKGGKSEAGIVGDSFRTSVENAILANGFFAHISELEDDQYPGPTSDITIFPVILPLAEKLGLSGKELIEASVVGTEIMTRFSYYTQPRTAERGFIPLPYYGVIGAGIVAAKALKLDKEKTKATLGLSFTQGTGSYVNIGTVAHYLESAWSCRNGWVAAEMANLGFTSGTNLEKWLISLLGEDGVKLEAIINDIGKSPFFIHNIWIKKYPCCGLTHRQADSLFMLIKEHKFTAEDVAEIRVDVGTTDYEACNRVDPADIESSKFSYQHILSAVMLDGEIDMDTFTDIKISDPQFKAFRPKIKLIAHPEWGGGSNAGIPRVTVRFKNGKSIMKEMDQPIGGNKFPLTSAQIVDLYRKYTRNILTEEQISRTIDMTLDMENISDLSELINIITFRN